MDDTYTIGDYVRLRGGAPGWVRSLRQVDYRWQALVEFRYIKFTGWYDLSELDVIPNGA